jgi:hypothetical protein
MDHHYVPQFYLRQWADPDGRIPSYRWLGNRAVFSHIKSSKGTGYETDLYAQEHVASEDRHKVETGFFKVLDDKAAQIHARLIRREPFIFTAEERMDWSIFLAAANARTPDIVRNLKTELTAALRDKLEDQPERVEQELGYKPNFTLAEWAEKNAPAQLSNFYLSMLLKFIVREDVIQRYMDMEWTVHEPRSRHKEFLTCDRPLWYHRRPEHPQFTVMMTLSPQTVFIASSSPEQAQRFINVVPMRLTRLVNESVFNKARERVYGRTSLDVATRLFRLSRFNQKRRDKIG